MRDEQYPITSWTEIETMCQWTGLLVGNGASLAVWPQFGYRSLFERACAPKSQAHLTAEDQQLFAAFDHTTNFEVVLAALSTSETVCQTLALDQEYQAIHLRHLSIRQALQRAIHAVHVPYAALKPATLAHLRQALLAHERIFTTSLQKTSEKALVIHPRDESPFLFGAGRGHGIVLADA